MPTFVADVAGTYVASLVVNDGKVNSSPITVAISAAASNIAPVANPGVAQTVVTGALVTLDGSKSTDANGDSLSYRWIIMKHPDFSKVDSVPLPNKSNPTFVADTSGVYEIQLDVFDGKTGSPFTTVIVTAVPPAIRTNYEVESNNTTVTATNMIVNSTMTGSLNSASDVDWFAIQLAAGFNHLNFQTQISNNNQYLNMSIFMPDNTQYSDDIFAIQTGKTGLSNGVILSNTGGLYLIRIQTPQAAPQLLYNGSYSITITR